MSMKENPVIVDITPPCERGGEHEFIETCVACGAIRQFGEQEGDGSVEQVDVDSGVASLLARAMVLATRWQACVDAPELRLTLKRIAAELAKETP